MDGSESNFCQVETASGSAPKGKRYDTGLKKLPRASSTERPKSSAVLTNAHGVG